MPAFRWVLNSCRIMGILNVTPDSFSDGGDYLDVGRAVDRGLQMESEGAALIDVGGESTRPGSAPVPVEEQIRRVVPVIRKLSRELTIPISIDTTRARVAQAALEAGASVVNDVSAGLEDLQIVKVVCDSHAPVILMHRLRSSQTMQENVIFDNVVQEVLEHLLERARHYEESGMAKEQICLDPGIGFGKFVEHNLELTRNLNRFVKTGYGVLYGGSRKSFIKEILNIENPRERDSASLVFALEAAQRGAHWVRVHDVAATADALRIREVLQAA